MQGTNERSASNQSLGNEARAPSSNLYKTAKNLFTKKFSLKMGSNKQADDSKPKKFQSNIPGTKTSKSGLAYIPSNEAKSQSPTQNKSGVGSKLLLGSS